MGKTMSRIMLTTCLALSVVGVGCSGSGSGSSSSSGFCEAMRNREVGLAVKNTDGNVDLNAVPGHPRQPRREGTREPEV